MLKSFSHIAIFIGVVKLVYVSASCSCADYEVWDPCIKSCPPRICGVDETVIRCAPPPQPGDPDCVAGCRCADNLYRNDKGVCVPKNQCPIKCGVNEIQTSCIQAICEARNCSDLGKLIRCVRIDTQFCTSGCLCKEGYLRNKNGTCVPIKQCPSTKVCGRNEIPTPCFEAICERRNCSDLGKPFSCVRLDPRFCTNGCLCKEGYLRNEAGFCVPIDQCPNTNVCGKNEIPTSCIQSICERRNCSDIGKPIACVRLDPSFCTDGCLCKEGYLRDEATGVCVPIGQCPNIQCGPNEMFDPCPPPCPGEGCRVDPTVILCLPNPQPGDPDCNPGCRCRDNYFRNDYGFCVTRDECHVCGENEIPTSCIQSICERRNCSDIGKPIACVRLDPSFCTDGCLCKEGYLRDEATGVCVPIGQCPNIQCGPNEIFDPCPPPCPGEGCRVDPTVILCLPNPQPGDPDCNPGCRCRDNYFRNDYGFCVTRDECPKPPTVICGPDEVPTDCVNGGCGIWYCSQTQEICNLLLDEDCKPGCFCRNGFLRAENGTCIPADQCPPKCGLNEYFSCGGPCDNVCATLNTQNQTNCPIVNKKCNPKCYCKEGYARDDNNICIPIKKCPPPKPIITCGPDEVYDSCVNGGCRGRSCSQPEEICINLIEGGCREGCRCKDGMLRTDDGICIPANQCPINCRGQNEIRGCKLNCPPQTCESIGKNITCPPQTKECIQACRCKEGFFRNKRGECISRADCLKCRGPNEFFSCGGACDNVCSTLKIQNQNDCPIINIVCNKMCYCEEGFARDSNNRCIPISKCPPPKCGPNEVAKEQRDCTSDCCPQPADQPSACPDPCSSPCKCNFNSLRDPTNGTCIRSSDCPVIPCGKNEQFNSCPSTSSPFCSEQCSNASPDGNRCSKVVGQIKVIVACRPGCVCMDNYWRNDNNECVPYDQCPVCGINEIYDVCPAPCPPKNCDDLGKMFKCKPSPKPGDPECNPGCRCADNFYRNKQGVCVPKNECPLNCYGQNEVVGCQNSCSPQTCESIGKKYNCPLQSADAVCKQACICKKGYFRNVNGQCVSKEDCLKCRGPNEFFSCGGACDNVCSTLKIQNQNDCPIVNIVCNPMCYCKEGFARDSNNTCIPISKCPPPKCGPNEVAKEQRDCTSDCCPQPADQPSACPDPCSSPCKCSFNSLRDPTTGTCIRSSDCPAIPCGKNEKFDSCPSTSSPFCSEQCSKASPDGNRCSKVVGRIGIVVACRPGCVCIDNYWRNNNNACVPYDECSPTCGKNEVYDTCLPICPTQSCDFDSRVALCAPNPKPGDPQCKPGCRCIDKYFRNKLGQCVRKDQCDNYNNTSNGLKEFEQGNVRFTLRFLYEAAKAKPGVSLIISPFSVLFLLAQLALYATGTVLEQLLRLLNLDSKPKIRSVIPNYLDSLSAQTNVIINLAAKIYASKLCELSSNFKTDTREIFKAEAQNLDFSKPNEAASIINAWVEQKTNNLIKNLVPPNSLNSNTILVLVNAIYFKGDWEKKFDPKNTRKTDFYVDKDKTVQVNMMSRTGPYKYAEIKGLNAQVIELPYKSENFSLMICLPIAKDGINNLLDGLSDSNFSLGGINNHLQMMNIAVKVPAFTISSTWDLKEYLMKNNNASALFKYSSGLQNIMQKPKPIYVSSGTQKATIIVNESGSEAAAASAIMIRALAVPVPVKTIIFTADHQFIFFIIYKGTPIFSGLYAGP